MNENGGKSSTILLTVIGIATLLVVVVGATFAYFAAQVNGDPAASVTIQAASDGTAVAIGGTEAVTLTGIYPKEDPWLTKEVTLNVPGTTGSTTVAGYSFDLVVTENNYTSGPEGNSVNDLSYTFTNTQSTGSNITKVTTKKTKLDGTTRQTGIATGTIARNTTADLKFELKVYFDMEDSVNQNPGDGNKKAVFNVVMNWKDDINASQS